VETHSRRAGVAYRGHPATNRYPVKHRGTPTNGVVMISGWMVPRGRAPGLENQAGIILRRSLLWGCGGVNISPMAVSAPEEGFEKYRRYVGETVEHVCKELERVVEEVIGRQRWEDEV